MMLPAPWHTVAVVVTFALSYLLIAAPALRWLPIGRAGAALVGATVMVALGALSPEQSYRAISGDTIALLFGMMVISVYLERAGVFSRVADWALALALPPRSMLAGIAVISAGLSAFLVNDTVCVFMTPVVVRLCRRARLPLGPYLIALATSANLGSAATLVGNPQNMLVGSMSDLGFLHFFARVGPVVLVALAAHVALLLAYYGRAVGRAVDTPSATPPEPAATSASRHVGAQAASLVFVAVVALFFSGAHMGYSALAGAGALIVLDRRDAQHTIAAVNWPLLVFFAGLFIIVEGLRSTGLVGQAFDAVSSGFSLTTGAGITRFTVALTAGSNIVSNVPMVVLAGPELARLGGAEVGWILMAYVTTVAGNLTLVGSVANLIVAEGARPHYRLGFREYLRFGVLSTLVSLAIGVPLLIL